MKVPIDVDDKAKDANQQDEAQQQSEAPAGEDDKGAQGDLSPEDEAAMVEAAKRAGEAAAADDMKKDADKARAERDDLQRQLAGLEDEMEAAKKEAADATSRLERLDEKERAAEKLVTNLLPVLDDMERAIAHASGAAAADGKDDQFDQFVAGVQAVHDKMLGILAREGVEAIDPAGQPFDPLVHQAVGREENKDAYDETVAQVYQRGYRMGGKVIRTAMVTVTYGGPKRPAEGAKPSTEVPDPKPDASGADGDKQ